MVSTPKKEEESSFVVCRQAGGHLALRGLDLFIDGKEVKTFRSGSSAEIIVSPGQHRLTFKFPWDAGIKDLDLNSNVRSASTKMILIGPNLDSFFVLPKVGGFTVTWRASEVGQLPKECEESPRQIIR